MEKQSRLLAGMFVLSLLLLLFTYLDWASLHDIRQDYVSWEIIDHLGMRFSEPIPDWTNTTGEWVIVRVALAGRILFFILNAILLGSLIRRLPETAN